MIEYISGKIAALSPTAAVIETASGVGFLINITLPTYTELQGKNSALLLVHESIREDAWTLYGFLTQRERELFRALIGVSGVGAATASVILSSLSVTDLEAIISTGDDSRLKKVKGIGQKTAQRIIVDLRDKIKIDDSALLTVATTATNEVLEEAVSALVMLGFQKQPAQKVVKKLIEQNPAIKVEAAIKKALAML